MTKFIGQPQPVSKQRKFLNETLIPKFSGMLKAESKLVIIGIGINWDYDDDFPQCDIAHTEVDKNDTGLKGRAIYDDICKSQIGTEFMDGVLYNGVWETVDDPLKAMWHLNRILKVGGLMLFGAPFKMGTWDKDYWRVTPKGAEKVLKDNNFEILEAHNIDDVYLYYLVRKLKTNDFPA